MENKVKELRTKLGLSLWDLASKVSASPEQIQRIENGRVPAPMALANAICEVLGKPVKTVFPASAKVLNTLRADIEAVRHPSQETLTELRRAGLEADPRRYTLKVLLRGHQQTLLFRISAAEEARLFEAVQNERSSRDGVSFIVFETEDSTVAINLSSLMFCHFLWDAAIGTVIPDFPAGDAESPELGVRSEVVVYLAQDPKPLTFRAEPETNDEETEDVGDFSHILYMLDSGCNATDRLHFDDSDGEDVFLRVGDITLLKVPLWILDEDERNAIEGLDDEEGNQE